MATNICPNCNTCNRMGTPGTRRQRQVFWAGIGACWRHAPVQVRQRDVSNRPVPQPVDRRRQQSCTAGHKGRLQPCPGRACNDEGAADVVPRICGSSKQKRRGCNSASAHPTTASMARATRGPPRLILAGRNCMEPHDREFGNHVRAAKRNDSGGVQCSVAFRPRNQVVQRCCDSVPDCANHSCCLRAHRLHGGHNNQWVAGKLRRGNNRCAKGQNAGGNCAGLVRAD